MVVLRSLCTLQVLVKSLFDRGFLFLLSSSQMVESKGAKKLFFSSLFLIPSQNKTTPTLAQGEDLFVFALQSGGGGLRRTYKHYSSFRSRGLLSSPVSIFFHELSSRNVSNHVFRSSVAHSRPPS